MQHLSTAIRCFTLFLLAVFAAGVSAQSQSLNSVLNSDGSLNLNATGSFDTAGYRMISGPNGEPRFLPASQSTVGTVCTPDRWDTTFSTNGVNGDVIVIASDGLGNIYIGGNFTAVQGTSAPGIAKWNGSTWSGLGSGIGGQVNAIAFNGLDIYVGGSFGGAGGNPAKNVAKWNGSSWSNLGAGLGGGTHVVEAVVLYNGSLYAGGNFNTGDGSPTAGVARWDGSAWTAVGTGAPSSTALAVNNGLLYAGTFAAPGVLTWDGTNWASLGSLPGSVSSLTFAGTELWATGSFNFGGSTGLAQVVKWNGTTWERIAYFGSFRVNAITKIGTDLYVGGSFTRQGGQQITDGLFKYDGVNWTGINGGTEGGGHEVMSLLAVGNTLYVGGDFLTAGSLAAKNLATLTNGSTWAGFTGTGIDNTAAAIAPSGTDVYLGGSFISAGPLTANRIAKWDGVGNTFSTLGVGITGFSTEFSFVSAIAVAGGKVYAGGSFPRIGGVTASSIAVWNGSTWSALGTGVTGGNARVNVIIAQGDEIIIGGDFTTAGGAAANRLARWNGTSWSALPGSPPVPTPVVGIGFIGTDMYVGSISAASENPNYVLKYDGTSWTGIAPGMGGHGITSMVVIGSDLYVSGGFQAINGVPAIRVAKWNGTSWSALGSGLPTTSGSASVYLGTTGSDLIASGDFSPASGAPAGFIARWNGSGWSTLGNGLNTFATRIVSSGGDLFIGGGFNVAGCNQSPYFARWRETQWTGSAGADWHNAANWGGASVPPPNAGITISANNATISSADVSVSSLIVTNGKTLAIGAGRTLTVNGKVEVNNGFLTGPGSLVVNGDLTLSNGDVNDLSSITVNSNLYLNGGKITGTAPVNLTTCRATALSGGNTTSFIAAPLTRCIGSSGTYVFPVGTGTVYAPVELSNISGSGNLTIESNAGAYVGASGLPANRLQRWWQFLSDGTITQANIVFGYIDAEVVGQESRYRIYRINSGTATQLPTTLNQASNRATVTGATSLARWTLAEGIPTPLTMSGRATNPNGRGAAHVLVSLDDGQGNIRYTMTNPFGYYRFMNVTSFQVYTVKATSKKYTITNSTRVVDFDEFTPAINFVSSDN